MSDSDRDTTEPDDVEGHRLDDEAEAQEADDTEGHGFKRG